MEILTHALDGVLLGLSFSVLLASISIFQSLDKKHHLLDRSDDISIIETVVYNFSYGSFNLSMKVDARFPLDEFDLKATEAIFQSLSKEQKGYNYGGWSIFISVYFEKVFWAYYQAIKEDISISDNVEGKYFLWFTLNDAILITFEEIGKYNHGSEIEEEIPSNIIRFIDSPSDDMSS